MRPAAKQMVDAFDTMKEVLRQQALKDPRCYSEKVKASLRHFDHCWSTFENLYVRCIVPLKNMREFEIQQEMAALLSEAVLKGLKSKVITQDMIEDYEPSVMFTVPRLAVLSGLLFSIESKSGLPKDHCLAKYIPTFDELPLIKERLKRLDSHEVHMLERKLADASIEEKTQRRQTINDLFIDISQLSDTLQSGERTKDFRELLKTTFYLYTKHPLADESSLLESPENSPELEQQPREEAFSEFRRLSVSLIAENRQGRHELERTLGSEDDATSSPSISTNTPIELARSESPLWKSSDAMSCSRCELSFSVFRRRHHCRNCGDCFCSKCSPHYIPIPKFGFSAPVRVCKQCYASLRQESTPALPHPSQSPSTSRSPP
eukprot:Sdes_comp20481_c0_seq1m14812